MLVIIKKAKEKSWYADMLDEVIEVFDYDVNSTHYKSCDKEFCFIEKANCEIF